MPKRLPIYFILQSNNDVNIRPHTILSDASFLDDVLQSKEADSIRVRHRRSKRSKRKVCEMIMFTFKSFESMFKWCQYWVGGHRDPRYTAFADVSKGITFMTGPYPVKLKADRQHPRNYPHIYAHWLPTHRQSPYTGNGGCRSLLH